MDRAQVLSTIARVCRRNVGEISDTASLGTLGVTSSLGLTMLRSALEAESRRPCPVLDLEMRVSDVISAVIPTTDVTRAASESARVDTATVRIPSAPGPSLGASQEMLLGVGLDMQEIDSLPLAEDYRTEAFYAGNFSPVEIATAMLRPDARAHLCGVFCLKEAIKKSHPDLLNTRMDEILVSHDSKGKPSAVLSRSLAAAARYRFLVSITHTAKFAAATCVTIGKDK